MASSRIWLWIGAMLGSFVITAIVIVATRAITQIVQEIATLQKH
jgi:uncharacterized membrane protein YdcZ (DUF606 family)